MALAGSLPANVAAGNGVSHGGELELDDERALQRPLDPNQAPAQQQLPASFESSLRRHHAARAPQPGHALTTMDSAEAVARVNDAVKTVRIQPATYDSPDDSPAAPPTLSHRLKHDKSILALVVAAERIYAGTQKGEILVCFALVLLHEILFGPRSSRHTQVYSLESFERLAVIEGHRGSVLGLCLSQDQTLLFSSAGDRIVNVS